MWFLQQKEKIFNTDDIDVNKILVVSKQGKQTSL